MLQAYLLCTGSIVHMDRPDQIFQLVLQFYGTLRSQEPVSDLPVGAGVQVMGHPAAGIVRKHNRHGHPPQGTCTPPVRFKDQRAFFRFNSNFSG